MPCKNIPYYITAALIFIALKLLFRSASVDDLVFLLKPVDALFCLFTGSRSFYIPGAGYYHEALNIIINKSCAGFNYWVLCFAVFSYLLVKYIKKPLYKALALPASLLGSFFFTILVNASRMAASITVQSQTGDIFQNYQNIVHEATGIITYLTFLVLTYLLVETFMARKAANEETS
jgi:exosortase K